MFNTTKKNEIMQLCKYKHSWLTECDDELIEIVSSMNQNRTKYGLVHGTYIRW